MPTAVSSLLSALMTPSDAPVEASSSRQQPTPPALDDCLSSSQIATSQQAELSSAKGAPLHPVSAGNTHLCSSLADAELPPGMHAAGKEGEPFAEGSVAHAVHNSMGGTPPGAALLEPLCCPITKVWF